MKTPHTTSRQGASQPQVVANCLTAAADCHAGMKERSCAGTLLQLTV